jgi:two-component system sensor histidine kinase DesK
VRALPALPPETDALLATVLREAATNVVRHSAARTCQVTARSCDGRMRLRITNDGARPPGEPTTGVRRGTGLDNLSARAEKASRAIVLDLGHDVEVGLQPQQPGQRLPQDAHALGRQHPNHPAPPPSEADDIRACQLA